MRRRASSKDAGDPPTSAGRVSLTPRPPPRAFSEVFRYLFASVVCIGTLLALAKGDLRWGWSAALGVNPLFARHVADADPSPTHHRLVSPAELAARDGVSDPTSEIWLSILGEVYDVSSGARFYGPEGGYRGFAGRDATRAFHTGEFDDAGLVPNLDGLPHDACLALEEWAGFYRSADEYPRVGVLAPGEFHDERGAPTAAKRAFDDAVARARHQRAAIKARDGAFPACASRWSAEEGGEVWCEDGRTYPRKEVSFVAGKRRVRCACFPDTSFSDARQLYPGCENTATRCKTG